MARGCFNLYSSKVVAAWLCSEDSHRLITGETLPAVMSIKRIAGWLSLLPSLYLAFNGVKEGMGLKYRLLCEILITGSVAHLQFLFQMFDLILYLPSCNLHALTGGM